MDGDSFMLNACKGGFFSKKPHRPTYRKTGSWTNPGAGMRFSVEGDDLVIRVNLKENVGKSASGKSMRLGHSGGNLAIGTLECMKGVDLPPYLVFAGSLFCLINPIESHQ